MPILKTLYNVTESDSHHIYMSLIILLMLSEDSGFSQTVHQITLKSITWYTERALTEISLGGLLVLVVIRTIHYNMLKMRVSFNLPIFYVNSVLILFSYNKIAS